MSVITFSESLKVGKFRFGRQHRSIEFSSAYAFQSVGVAGPLWTAFVAQSNQSDLDAGDWIVLEAQLAGKTNQLALWNLKRPAPLGTLRGTLTLNGAHTQSATSLLVSGGAGQAGATVEPGDLLGLGTGETQQVVMAMAQATADGAGDITIDISSTPLRNAFSTGASVTWDKPKALFRHTATSTMWDYTNGSNPLVSGIALDLIESWQP